MATILQLVSGNKAGKKAKIKTEIYHSRNGQLSNITALMLIAKQRDNKKTKLKKQKADGIAKLVIDLI